MAPKQPAKRRKILDDDGIAVLAGSTITFSYGIPPVRVVAPVIMRDGELIAITKGHSPEECPVAELRDHVGSFYVDIKGRKPSRRYKIGKIAEGGALPEKA